MKDRTEFPDVEWILHLPHKASIDLESCMELMHCSAEFVVATALRPLWEKERAKQIAEIEERRKRPRLF